MDFTIITPSFNYDRFISDCLESVAAQSGVTLEHLIMDGGSTDQTANIVSRFCHASFFQEPDDGMTDAINKGFSKAKGRWVMWLNADDRLHPHVLADVKSFADGNSKTDVIYGCWNFVDIDGIKIRRMTLFPFQKQMLFYHGCYIASTSTFYRKATILDEGYFLDKQFYFVMDGEYFCRLAKAGKRFCYYPKVLADFRLHDGSLSQRHLDHPDIENVLARQKQLAESRTIRRFYGGYPFKDEMLNSIAEGILYHYYRIWKGLLRFVYRYQCKNIL